MRILHVNLSVAHGRYGTLFGRALSMCDDLEAVSVFNSRLHESAAREALLRDVEYLKLPFSTPTGMIHSMRKLRVLVRRWQPDIIHDSAGPMSRSPLLWFSLRDKAPLVMTVHDPLPHAGMGYSARSKLARALSHHYGEYFFVHGPIGKSQLVDQGIAPDRVSVIRHGQLAPLFAQGNPEGLKREDYTVLFFGEMRPNKGMELLLPIADKIQQEIPDIKFIVAGSPKVSRELRRTGWPQKLSSILDEMDKRPYFEVHAEFIPDSEVEELFRRASITLLPYLDATQSGVAMIAMPLETVVLATNVGDLPYTIENGVTGFLADPNLDSIVAKLTEVLNDRYRMEVVRKNAKEWAYHECSWDKQVELALEAYKALVGEEKA